MVISRALVCVEGRNPDQLGPEALTRGPRGRALGQLLSAEEQCRSYLGLMQTTKTV